MRHDLTRYHRQMLLPGFGEDGQRRLLRSTALLVGCGALGTVSANMLARAGVGKLIIVDRDYIELSNLQRQVLFDERDVADAIPKAEAARRKIAAINSQIEVTAVVDDLNHRNIERYAQGADILIDGADNFEARYLVNDLAVRNGLPFVYGGAVGTSGMAFAILPHSENHDAPWERSAGIATPCFRCLFEQPPPAGMNPTCDTVGVLGPAVSIIANFQACEALKILLGHYEHVCPTMLNIDVWNNSLHQLSVAGARDGGDCPCCKQRRFEYLDGKSGARSTALCGRDAVQISDPQTGEQPDFDELAARLRAHGTVSSNRFMLRANIVDHGKSYELTLFTNGRAIIKGTDQASVARMIYARYVGA